MSANAVEGIRAEESKQVSPLTCQLSEELRTKFYLQNLHLR